MGGVAKSAGKGQGDIHAHLPSSKKPFREKRVREQTAGEQEDSPGKNGEETGGQHNNF